MPVAASRDRLHTLPSNPRVTAADWAHLSTEWRNELDDRIARLTRLRDQMSSCIGCGCLSIDECPLRNPYDELSEQGSGPRLLDPASPHIHLVELKKGFHVSRSDKRRVGKEW